MKYLLILLTLSAVGVFRDKNGRYIGSYRKTGTYIQYYDRSGRHIGTERKGIFRDKNGRYIGTEKKR